MHALCSVELGVTQISIPVSIQSLLPSLVLSGQQSLAYGTSLHFLPLSLHLTLSFRMIYVNCMAVFVASIHAVLRPLLSWFLLTAQNSALLPSSAINLAFNVLIVLNSWQFSAHASLFHFFGAFFCSSIFLCLTSALPFLVDFQLSFKNDFR